MLTSTRDIMVPEGSGLSVQAYRDFLIRAYKAMQPFAVLAPDQGVDSLELAHLLPGVPETVIAIYLGINDAPCHKGLVSPFLVNHGHNSVFAFDPEVYSGGDNVPGGTIDAARVLQGFSPPNATWPREWTYVMIQDPKRTLENLWAENGYIDMICAKYEDFQLKSGTVCIFIDSTAFRHEKNRMRTYLDDARKRGAQQASQFTIPESLEGEFEGLEPVILQPGERIFVASPVPGRPCAHGWVEHPKHVENQDHAYIEEFSAVPFIAKPPIADKYISMTAALKPAGGSADMTTDWFKQGLEIYREPLLKGLDAG